MHCCCACFVLEFTPVFVVIIMLSCTVLNFWFNGLFGDVTFFCSLVPKLTSAWVCMHRTEMPTECITNPLQRELADSIIRMVPLDEIRILLACGAKVNEPVTQGLRPLHYAVWQRYLEAAQLLLVRGSDINARDECGYSALHLSAEHG